MLQGGEIIIIVLLALIVLGPARLPEIARKLGQWTAELRSSAREMAKGLEAEVADIKQVGEDLKAPVDELRKPVREIGKDLRDAAPGPMDWTGPKPMSGPTPEEALADLDEIENAAESDEESE